MPRKSFAKVYSQGTVEQFFGADISHFYADSKVVQFTLTNPPNITYRMLASLADYTGSRNINIGDITHKSGCNTCSYGDETSVLITVDLTDKD